MDPPGEIRGPPTRCPTGTRSGSPPNHPPLATRDSRGNPRRRPDVYGRHPPPASILAYPTTSEMDFYHGGDVAPFRLGKTSIRVTICADNESPAIHDTLAPGSQPRRSPSVIPASSAGTQHPDQSRRTPPSRRTCNPAQHLLSPPRSLLAIRCRTTPSDSVATQATRPNLA